MSTDTQKTELLAQFQRYLDKSQIGTFSTQEQPDLHTLLSELTALKTEVKAESRQYKNTLDTLSSALEIVQEDNKALIAELAANTERLIQQQADMQRTMLLEMVDLYDRLSTGTSTLQNYQPVNALFKHSQKKDVRFIERFKEGQVMTLRRFEQLLQRYQVRPIECVGKLLDPVTMSAVETGNAPQQDNGIVLQELRKGFLYQDQILRLAEVKVNKTKVG
jgi:molecular chaperone GrpE